MAVKMMTIGQMAKEQPPFPVGTWTIQAQQLSVVQDVEKSTKSGETFDTDVFTLSVIPTVPGSNVDPDALSEIDPATGKPAYEGQRIFLNYTSAYQAARKSLSDALRAFGFADDVNPYELAQDSNNDIRGRVAKGDLTHARYHRRDDKPNEETGIRQDVKNWGKAVKSAEYQL